VAGQDRQRVAGHRLVVEDHRIDPARSRATASHEERPCNRRSTGGWTRRIVARPSLHPAAALDREDHTHGCPDRLRSCRSRGRRRMTVAQFLGSFIGQDIPVALSAHWPHIRQSNSSPLTTRSTAATGARRAGSRDDATTDRGRRTPVPGSDRFLQAPRMAHDQRRIAIITLRQAGPARRGHGAINRSRSRRCSVPPGVRLGARLLLDVVAAGLAVSLRLQSAR